MPYSHFQSLIININKEYYNQLFKLPDINQKNIYYNNIGNYNIINKTLKILKYSPNSDISQNNICIKKNKKELSQLLSHKFISLSDIKKNIFKNNPVNKSDKIYDRISDNKCNICFDYIDDMTVNVNCCNNNFCLNCIFNWIKKKNSCPICRNKIDINTIKIITKNKNFKTKNKIQLLINLIKNNNFSLDQILICLHKNTDVKKFTNEFDLYGIGLDYNIFINKIINDKINIFIYNKKLINFDFSNIHFLIFYNIENDKIKNNIINLINNKDRKNILNIFNFINK